MHEGTLQRCVVCMLSIKGESVAAADRGRLPRGRRRQAGTCILYSVPYSEHSSHAELRSFVEFLQPTRIVPSVGNTSPDRAREMVASLGR